MIRFAQSMWIACLILLASTAASVAAHAEDPLAKVENLVVSGRHAEAQAAAREAQRFYEAKGDRNLEALSILLLASAELASGDLNNAATDFERSATLLEATGDRFSAWLALDFLGDLERLRKRPAAALARFEQALALVRVMEGLPGPLSSEGVNRLPSLSPLRLLTTQREADKVLLLGVAEGVTRADLVATLLDAGRLEEGEAELARLAQHSQAFGGALDGEVAILRGGLLRQLGRLDEARGQFREILEHPTLTTTGQKGNILEELTQIETESRRFDEALAWNDQALTLARRAAGPEKQSQVLVLRAQILLWINRLEAAATTLNEALGAAKESGSKDHQGVVHQQLGLLESRQARNEKAAVHLETAVRLFHDGGQLDLEARAWIQLVNIYHQLGSLAAAKFALDKARALAEQSGSRPLDALADLAATQDPKEFLERWRDSQDHAELREGQAGEFLQRLSGLWIRLEQIEDGTSPEASGWDPAEAALETPIEGFAVVVRGMELLAQRRFGEAREVLQPALAQAPSDRELELRLLSAIGYSHFAERNFQEALRYLTQAVAALERGVDEIRLEETLAGYLGGSRQGFFGLIIDLLGDLLRHEEAFDYSERARARAFLQGLGSTRIQLPNGADGALAQEAKAFRRQILEIERQRASSSDTDRQRLSMELHQARERYEALLFRLKVTNPDQPASAKLAPLQLRAVQAELPPNSTLVSYFVLRSHVRAWVLDRESFRSVPLLFSLLPGQIDLGEFVCWAEDLARQGGGRGAIVLGRPCANAYTSEGVYEKLFAPLRPYIRHRRLILIPHGELHYIPFAALRDPKTGRYLIEDYTLTYAPSASVLGQLRSKESPVKGRALVVGAPDELDPRLPSLPAAQREAKGVARLLRTRPLLGAAATEGQLYEIAGKVDLLHIAAHGFYEPRNPLFSRLALAPDQGHDGNLEVHEIADLDLSGVNLVVLSACETARGERSEGDEITSLARAFLSAGSPGVVSTLWSIDDDAAESLMKELYRRLLAGASTAEALQQAQLSLLRSRRYNQPQFWAAFALTGDPQGRWGKTKEGK